METLVSRFMEGTSSKQAGLHHVINLFRQLHLFDSVQTYQSHDCTFPALNIANAKRRNQLVTSGIKEQPSVTKECSTTGTPTHGIFKAKTHSIEHFSFRFHASCRSNSAAAGTQNPSTGQESSSPTTFRSPHGLGWNGTSHKRKSTQHPHAQIFSQNNDPNWAKKPFGHHNFHHVTRLLWPKKTGAASVMAPAQMIRSQAIVAFKVHSVGHPDQGTHETLLEAIKTWRRTVANQNVHVKRVGQLKIQKEIASGWLGRNCPASRQSPASSAIGSRLAGPGQLETSRESLAHYITWKGMSLR